MYALNAVHNLKLTQQKITQMSKQVFKSTEHLTMAECSKRLDMLMKIYNRFSTSEIEAVLKQLYINKITSDIIVEPDNLLSLPFQNKRKYEKKVKTTDVIQ